MSILDVLANATRPYLTELGNDTARSSPSRCSGLPCSRPQLAKQTRTPQVMNLQFKPDYPLLRLRRAGVTIPNNHENR
jgi:hypothetical protein